MSLPPPLSVDAVVSTAVALISDSLPAWTKNPLIVVPVRIVVLIVAGLVLRWVVHRVINRTARRSIAGAVSGVLQRNRKDQVEPETAISDSIRQERRQQRATTIASLLRSISTAVIFVVVIVMVLQQLGFNVGPVIASAGVVGVAIGFGAQTLVKDFLSGIFMLLEDQYGVGDSIDMGDASGTVEAVGLRVTRLRDVNGTVWYVRNGDVVRIGNKSQNWARAVVDVPVGHSADLADAESVLTDVAQALAADDDFKDLILEEPEVWGVERLEAGVITIRLVLKVAPLQQFKVQRELRQRIKAAFDEHGIPIARPVMWSAGDTGK